MGILGLLLAVMGVYGVASYAANQRTREIGIRMALGAGRSDILRLISRQGLRLVIVGIAVGVTAAGALTRAMVKLLIGTSPTDPLTYAAVAILLAGVTLLACWIPGRPGAACRSPGCVTPRMIPLCASLKTRRVKPLKKSARASLHPKSKTARDTRGPPSLQRLYGHCLCRSSSVGR